MIAVNGIFPFPDAIRNRTYPVACEQCLCIFGEPSADANAFNKFVTGPNGQKVAEENEFMRTKLARGFRSQKYVEDIYSYRFHRNMRIF